MLFFHALAQFGVVAFGRKWIGLTRFEQYVQFNSSYEPSESELATADTMSSDGHTAAAAAAAAGLAGSSQEALLLQHQQQLVEEFHRRQEQHQQAQGGDPKDGPLAVLRDSANMGLALDAAAALDRFSRSATVGSQKAPATEEPRLPGAEAGAPSRKKRRTSEEDGGLLASDCASAESVVEDLHRRLSAPGDGGGFGGGLKISIPKGREHGDVLPIPLGAAPTSPVGRVTRSSSRASGRPPMPAGGLASPQPPSGSGFFPMGSTILRSPRDLFGFNSPLYANSPRGGPNLFNLQTPGSRGFSPRTVELYMRQFAESGVLSPRSAFAAPAADASGASSLTGGAAGGAASNGKSPTAGSKRKR